MQNNFMISSNEIIHNSKAGHTRDDYVDALSGILIIHMIVGHIFQWSSLTDSPLYSWMQRILFFFMPWFFYKSGMYFKEKNILTCFKSSIRKLIKPYIIFTVCGLPYIWFNLFTRNDENWVHYVLSPVKMLIFKGNNIANYPLWFLLSLFAVLNIYNFLHRYISTYIILILGFTLSITEYYINCNIPYYIPNICMGLSFYATGHLSMKIKLTGNKYLFPAIIICMLFVCVFPQYVDVRTNTLIYGTYVVWFLSSVISCFIYTSLFRNLEHLFPAWLVTIGKDSMLYYVLHWILISYTSLICGIFFNAESGWNLFFILLLCNILILPLLSYFLKSSRFEFIFK